jgi:hypothetical protein
MKLPGNRRMHVWHPDLPRRDCYAWSAIHNHRFSVPIDGAGRAQVNRRYNVLEGLPELGGSHDRVSHDGPRGPEGGRQSFVAGGAQVSVLPDEVYGPGPVL